MRSTLIILLLSAVILLPHSGAAAEDTPPAQSTESSPPQGDEAIRKHQEKISQIIAQRRKEALAREETTRRAAANGQPAEQPPSDSGQADTPPQRGTIPNQAGVEVPTQPQVQDTSSQPNKGATSSVVMGLKFVDKTGKGDYSVIVRRDEEFMTEVSLFNIDKQPVDEVNIAIQYDKRFLLPTSIFDSSLRSYQTSPPKFRILEAEGILVYNAKLKTPIMAPETVLLRIMWKAVRPTPFTGIEFAFDLAEDDSAPHTSIKTRGVNVLGIVGDPADGVLSGGLMIEPPPSAPKVFQGKAAELKTMYMGNLASQLPAGLRLIAPESEIEVGDDFTVQVQLDNKNGAVIDSINFFVLFDPKVLQVVDSDKFNWIIRGVNVLDGPYHREFPWDMHKANEVRNDRGYVQYQKAVSNGRTLPSGTFAEIHFRAIAPAEETSISFVRSRTGAAFLTSVRYFGFELLDLDQPSLSTPEAKLEVYNMSAEKAGRLTTKKEILAPVAAPKPREGGVRTLPLER